MDHGYQSWTRLHGTKSDREFIPSDVIKTRSWGLAHHAMFHTYPHHDSEGQASFVQVTSGVKFWVPMRPRPDAPDVTRGELYRDQLGFGGAVLDYDDKWDRWLIVAGPGDIM